MMRRLRLLVLEMEEETMMVYLVLKIVVENTFGYVDVVDHDNGYVYGVDGKG